MKYNFFNKVRGWFYFYLKPARALCGIFSLPVRFRKSHPLWVGRMSLTFAHANGKSTNISGAKPTLLSFIFPPLSASFLVTFCLFFIDTIDEKFCKVSIKLPKNGFLSSLHFTLGNTKVQMVIWSFLE